MPTTNLDTSDATEPAELLQLLHDWIGVDPWRLNESLNALAGSRACDLVELCVGSNRFTFLFDV